MPPTRTIPPAKAVKTERTHEENQERAYIAASRRSDRSLEARVESARRASEIHKRRTGRSLRVTEQDVINEEMYEEEDDDLPLQYRRLTAHLQTGSADFNRRLAAYLTNQVAMRSAVSQMANNPYGPHFANQGPYQQNMFQSPMMQQQPMPQSPGGMYRQAPYPAPHHPGFRPQPHGRAYSTVLPNKMSPPPGAAHSMDHRRMSTPAVIHPSGPPQINTDGIRPDNEYLRQTQSASMAGHFPQMWHDSGPFSTSLPMESQQMLAGTMDPNDPFSNMLMNGSENFMANPYYPWGDIQNGIKGMPVHPSAYPGMSATLAPAALDKHDVISTPDTSVPGTAEDNDFSLKRENSHQSLHSDHGNQGEGFWDNFVQDSSWNEEAATT